MIDSTIADAICHCIGARIVRLVTFGRMNYDARFGADGPLWVTLLGAAAVIAGLSALAGLLS